MKNILLLLIILCIYGCSDTYWMKRSDDALNQNMYMKSLNYANKIEDQNARSLRQVAASYKLKQYGLIKLNQSKLPEINEPSVSGIVNDVAKQEMHISQSSVDLGYVQEKLELRNKGREMTPFWIDDQMLYIGDEKGITDEFSGDYTSFLEVCSTSEDDSHSAAWMRSNDHVGPVAFSSQLNLVVFSKNIHVAEKNVVQSIPHLFYCKKVDGKWSKPFHLDLGEKKYIYTHPFISANGKMLYFVSNMQGGSGGLDIYDMPLSELERSRSFRNMIEINSTNDEQFPTMVEGQFYFASNRATGMGGLDIYAHVNGVTSMLSSPFNSAHDDFYPVIDKNNSWFISSNRNDDKGTDRIYRFNKVREMCLVRFIHSESGEVLTGREIELITNNSKEVILCNPEGNYLDLQYNQIVQVPGFENATIDSKTFGQTLLIPTMDVMMTPVKVIEKEEITPVYEVGKDIAALIQLNPIYFDKSSFAIRKDAAMELDKVWDFMMKNPNVRIQCRSHTDCRSSAASNLTLSDNRAKSAVEYLVSRGISAERLSYKGYGESQPLNDCFCEGKQKTSCSEEELAKNRRLEFIVMD